MSKVIVAAALLTGMAALAPAEARIQHGARVLNVHRATNFLTVLNRNGYLSAGWVQVLPGLATACNFRLDNGELTNKLVDLSRETGNISYTRDLYTTLYMIENHQARNHFIQAWSARFDGRQKEACDTAEALWGDTGHQFPGVLKRDAMNDGAGAVPSAAAPNCK